MRDQNESRPEHDIVIALAVSADFVQRIRPRLKLDLFAVPEFRMIASWCLEFWERHQSAPGPDHLYDVFLQKAATLPKDEAGFIEQILTALSKRHGDGSGFNADFAFSRAVEYFDRREVETACEAATDAAERGDFSAVRIAGWRIASVGTPSEKLADPWGDPSPPEFDVGILPPVLRRFARRRAAMIGVDAASVAWAALAACSGAIDGTIRLQMKRSDPGFTVPPALWVLLTGDPSTRKSPTLETAFAPLHKIQGERIRAWEREVQLWEKQDAQTRGPKPAFDQLITHDATTEGLRDLLATQDRGIIAYNDEWSRHVASMGKYGAGKDPGAADRAFFNVAYNGGPWVTNRANRKGSDRIMVPNLQVTVVGGVQPDILRQFNRGGALTADGMLQRCVPILMGKPRVGEATGNGRASLDYEILIRHLAAMEGPRTLQLTEAAEAVRARVEQRLFTIEQVESLGSGFMTAVGKLHGTWGRLTLTLAHVMAEAPDDVREVGKDAAELAERLIFESVLPNLGRFYQMLGGGGEGVEITRAVAGFLLREQRLRITASDVIQHVRALHTHKADQIRDAVSPLVTMDWLTPEGNDERRARAWEVNQSIYPQFAERAAQARAQAASAREIFATFIARADRNFGEAPSSNEASSDTPASADTPRARNKSNKDGDAPASVDGVGAASSRAHDKSRQGRFRDKVLHAAQRDHVRTERSTI